MVLKRSRPRYLSHSEAARILGERIGNSICGTFNAPLHGRGQGALVQVGMSESFANLLCRMIDDSAFDPVFCQSCHRQAKSFRATLQMLEAMRTGPDLILATKEYARDSTARSWWCVLSTAFLLLLALAGTLATLPLFARIICSVLAGLLMLRLFVIYHDQQHRAILPRSRLASLFMRGFGIYALGASSIWRSSHNHHHNHNSRLRGSHIGSFPIMTRTQFLRSSPRKRFAYLFVRHPLTILCGYVFMFLWGMCLNPFINSPRKHFDCLVALIAHLAIGLALLFFFGWQTLLLAQTIPHFVLYAIGTYLFYAQHNFPGVSFRDKAGWTYETAALESSSYMKTNPLMAWFTANIGCHHVHHLNSHIPFYRLPEAIREIPELQRAKTTSLNPIDIFRCLRLKVWDVEAQRMISLPELKRPVA